MSAPIMATSDPPLSSTLQAAQQQQSTAHYPALLHGPWETSTTPLFRVARGDSGLVTVALRHDSLSEIQWQGLGHFRLQQFLLWGWYDAESPSLRTTQCDPAFEVLPPETLHVLSGTHDGRILAYCCLEPATWPRAMRSAPASSMPAQGLPTGTFRIGDSHRPLFPTEIEWTGPHLFASLPLLRLLSIEQVREPSCLLRNYTAQTPLSIAAGMDVFCTLAEIVLDPAVGVHALVGHGEITLRRMVASMGVPVLYAPLAVAAPVLREQYWARDMDTSGKFWPFVIAIQDVREHAEHLRRLAAIVSYPERELRRALVRARKDPDATPARALLPLSHLSPIYWTQDPFFTSVREAALVGANAAYRDRR
jgi:hypothetical protein